MRCGPSGSTAPRISQVREERTQKRGDKEFVTVSLLSDFRPVGGILFAHHVEERLCVGGGRHGEPTVFSIRNLELDVEISDGLFVLPAACCGPRRPPRTRPAAGPR